MADQTAVVLLIGCMFVVCALGLVLVLVYLRNHRNKSPPSPPSSGGGSPPSSGGGNPSGGGSPPSGGGGGKDIVAELEKQLTTSSGNKKAYTCTGASWTNPPKDPHWTNGFMTGCWWKMYSLTKGDKWKKLAEAGTSALSSWKDKSDTHDIGFVIMSSYGNAPSKDSGVITTAARNLAKRWIKDLQVIRSWKAITETKVEVIIDSLMNLKLLFEGAKLSGKDAAEWRKIALAHAKTVKSVLQRDDGSTFHKATWEGKTKGSKKTVGTHQGASDSSTWARGQAWAVYGFTEVYDYTQDGDMLAAAKKAADYFVSNLPSDSVPYWDFSKKDNKDTSAAAIAAAGLLKLGKHEDKYTASATKILDSLKASYLGSAKNLASLLCCACVNVPKSEGVSVGYVVADYYFLEALELAGGG